MPGPSFRAKKGGGLKYPTGKTKPSGQAKTTSKPSKAYKPPVQRSSPKAARYTPVAATSGVKAARGIQRHAARVEQREHRQLVQRRRAVKQRVRHQTKAIAKYSKAIEKRSRPKLDSGGLLGPRQTKFTEELAKRTGLDARVLGGMAASEQPKDSPSIEGSDNWLNIGYFDTGPGGPTQAGGFFQGPKKAAALTAKFLKGKELGASEGIQAIARTAGRPPEEQIAAIQGSGWASSGHPNLPGLAAQMKARAASGKKVKPLERKLQRTGRALESTTKRAERLGLETIGKGKEKVRVKDYADLAKTAEQGKVALGGVGAQDVVKKKGGAWAGSKRAVLAAIPKEFRGEGTDDKRTPAYNASVGGSSTSDHLTTAELAYAADLPADDGLAQAIASKLGMASHTGTNEVVKDGYRYQLIWQDEGHYDHVHLGAAWVGDKLPPGTHAGGSVGTGAPTTSTVSATAGGTAAAGAAAGGTDPEKIARKATGGRRRRPSRQQRETAEARDELIQTSIREDPDLETTPIPVTRQRSVPTYSAKVRRQRTRVSA